MINESMSSDLIVDLAQYNIIDDIKIGSGIFGDIVKATFQETEENTPSEYAIQRCSEIPNARILKLFIKKIEVQGTIKHHAVLPMVGYSLPISTHNYYAVVTPFMKNENLFNLINKINEGLVINDFETKKTIISFGIAAGMACIHQKNIIHRDIKPSNVLLDENFYPKISDYNLNKFLLEKPDNDTDKQDFKIGTPAYWAPELYQNKEYSNKIDVYSYAITLYELWTMNSAFSEHKHLTQIELSRLVTSGQRPIIRKGEIPAIYQELIEKCWNEDPNLRPSFIQIVRDFMDRKNRYFGNDLIDKVEVNNYINDSMVNLNFFSEIGEPACFKCKNLAVEFCHKCFHPYCMYCFEGHQCDQLVNNAS